MRRAHRRVAALTLALSLAPVLTACGEDEPEPESRPSRLVLDPPSTSTGSTSGDGHTHGPGQVEAVTTGNGTRSTAGGYTLTGLRLAAGTDGPANLSFRIVGRDGAAVTRYDAVQTKELHLYVVRDDLAIYRHVHPTFDDGTWSVPVDLGAPGVYRVVADFQPTGVKLPVVLAADVTVPGKWRPQPVPVEPEGDDGVVRVRVDGGGTIGPDGRLRFVVTTLDGRSVQLGSYLGAAAHVSGFRGGLRAAQQVFVHVHPYGEPEVTDDGTVLTFHTVFKRPGDYRFFVQVRVDGIVHTVPVTATITRR
ncbi:hypothetical protein F0U44_09340 [Nocardioides humilatus]|uniref:Secreted protein n=1 Tax=Nocardioides humilatus TaxID=2607660 RepID=A0A5B1LFX9_9ACTN|nr:hypothetical protein [Nocardioides humilatus]KAA1418690.1 hypothetical protein F0U44_09340 [Nocardioides humilatus]